MLVVGFYKLLEDFIHAVFAPHIPRICYHRVMLRRQQLSLQHQRLHLFQCFCRKHVLPF